MDTIVEEMGGATPETPKGTQLNKTPMYEAMHAERFQRQALIRQIQGGGGKKLICYVGGIRAPIMRDDTIGIMELLHNVPSKTHIDFLLHTGGGDIDAAEKLIWMIRTAVGTGVLRVIVPDFAKSAGTLMALAADQIVMSDSSELGPIDPQVTLNDGRGNVIPHSVLTYLEAYETHSNALQRNPSDVVAQIMLNKLEPATVNLFKAVRDRARQLAEKHLNQWMFHKKKATYTKIAEDLMNLNKWMTHGQMINYQAAQALDLEVMFLDRECQEWRNYWRLYCLQRLAIKDNQKLFESDYASLTMDGPSS